MDFTKMAQIVESLRTGLDQIQDFASLLSDAADVIAEVGKTGVWADHEVSARLRVVDAMIDQTANGDITETAFRLMARVESLNEEVVRFQQSETSTTKAGTPKAKGRVQ